MFQLHFGIIFIREWYPPVSFPDEDHQSVIETLDKCCFSNWWKSLTKHCCLNIPVSHSCIYYGVYTHQHSYWIEICKPALISSSQTYSVGWLYERYQENRTWFLRVVWSVTVVLYWLSIVDISVRLYPRMASEIQRKPNWLICTRSAIPALASFPGVEQSLNHICLIKWCYAN